jgi:hypothetical protein
MQDVIEDLLGQITLQEKVSLLAGSDCWHTTPIEGVSSFFGQIAIRLII